MTTRRPRPSPRPRRNVGEPSSLGHFDRNVARRMRPFHPRFGVFVNRVYNPILLGSQRRTEEAVSERTTNRDAQVPSGAREWLGQMQSLLEQIQKQQQNSQQMMQELMNTY